MIDDMSKMQELNDDELEGVAGGKSMVKPAKISTKFYCPKCEKDKSFRVASGGRAYCNDCNTQIMV